jgi:hypothetical protein
MEKCKVFNLIIDEDRSMLLQLMTSLTVRMWDKYSHDMPEDAQKLQPVIVDLIKELSEKSHAQGWCKDPNCEHNQ